ncbi:cytochrome b5 reductase 4 isoform X1 [Pieris napi]|uniref:cytochrome b5 reductase 4 isoform X1 n=1 Tax=Pieris napi TaxID=78633 RepID=UPI001FBAF53B|nr:cytochrome b5 reductase 4 isoform X1 [Pieris napi]XP_047521507.1 cytochrome b5 reductase 4 isoform X1 [Pieris napi]
MSDTSKDDEDNLKENAKISLPTVLCTDSETEGIQTNIISESKLSLPSAVGTPTSPLLVNSPLSLPNSPTPFTKVHQTRSNKSFQSPELTLKQVDMNKTDTASATGNPRNKCALQPGHSLMDWIRLGNSGKDLTGVGGRMRPVSPSELSLHNTQNDAWLAIRGRVYNITHYLPYHPGGPEELMRGAGMDATELFDKVHPWVNYDSLLAKCLVGPLSYDRPDADELFNTPLSRSDKLREPSKAQLVRKSMENLANCITPVRKKITAKSEENVKGSPPSKIMQSLIQSSDLPVSISRRAAASPAKTDKSKDTPAQLRFDWIQTSTKIIISIYTGHLTNPGGSAKLSNGALTVEVATDGWLRIFRLDPEASLKDPLQLKMYSESGKIEVIALKSECKVWKGCGEASFSDAIRITTPMKVECRVMDVSRVTHDTSLITLAPITGPVIVPLGHHVRVHHKETDSECIRSYTPIGDGWDNSSNEFSCLKLAVKRYESGSLSLYLTSLGLGDVITLSGSYGNFRLHQLKPVKILYLIAAGTGITPMLSLIRFALSRSNPRCERVHLIFFNKTEEDILFKTKLEEYVQQDDRLQVLHVLSNASSTWNGLKGRISLDILSKMIHKDSNNHFACLCGPTEFTHTGVDLLKKIGVKDNFIHAFIG